MDSIAEHVLKERYYQPDESSWEDVCHRVADALFDESDQYNEIVYKLHDEGRFILNSPALMNLGTKIGNCSACYVLPIKDDMSDIFETLRKSALIFKSGGGVGINFSTLRPKHAIVKSTYGTSSGVMQFIEVYNTMVETVKAAGKRRGAAIAILNCDHPDIEEFIDYKNTEGKLSNFNISVLITDAFMDAVKNDEPWELQHDGIVYKTVQAKYLFDKIVKSMWTRSEPGVLYYDTMNKDNCLVHEFGPYITCNPCGEQILGVNYENGGGESCNLGSIDLSKAVVKYDNGYVLDYKYIRNLTVYAVKILDRLLDVNKFPVDAISECTLRSRKIGLGIMGLADMLIKLNLPYSSKEGRDMVGEVMKYIHDVAYQTSYELANDYGVYPAWNGKKETYRRNACILNVPPTGTISLFAGCSSGLEPNFGWVINRSTWVDGTKQTYQMVHPLFKEHFSNNPNYDKIVEWAFDHGTIQSCPYVNEHDKHVFQVAKDIHPFDHVSMQSAVQHWIDASCSKTINCPEYTTEEQISECIFKAWSSGCKGLTVYREGSRNDVVLETNASKKQDELVKVVEITNPVKYKLVTGNGRILPKTPKDSPAGMYKRTSGCGHMMIAIGEMDSKPHSVTIVNKGGCDALTQALAELTALALRWQVPLWDVRKVLTGVKCSAALKNPKSDGKSCPDILGQILRDYYPHDDAPPKNDEVEKKVVVPTIQANIVCPDCGGPLNFAEGCVSCPSCSYTKCS